MTNHFPDYIGQTPIINYLNRTLTVKRENPKFAWQPLALLGYAGVGKTKLAKKIYNAVAKIDKEYSFVKIPSGIGFSEFVNLFINEMEGRKVVAFIDEADTKSFNNRKVLNLLKLLTETERQIEIVNAGEVTLTANPLNHLWMIATNEETCDSALFGASGRFKCLYLNLCDIQETTQLIKLFAKKAHIKLSDSVSEFLANRVMPCPRAISELVENELVLYGNNISLDTAKQIVVENGRFPKGLRLLDLKALKFMGSDLKGKQIQEIAAYCAENERMTKTRVTTLVGLGLASTYSGKKLVTNKGLQYLRELV